VSLVGYPTPSLIGGVSQQPDALRFDNQARVSDNAWMSPVDGLVKRWATDHVGTLLTGRYERDPLVHAINRDKDERYVSLISYKKVRVFGLDGTEHGVYAPGGGAANFKYLNSHIELDNQLTNFEVFGPGGWTPDANAIAPAASGIEDPWRFVDSVALRNKVGPAAGGVYEHSTGVFEADGTWQVFYCHMRVEGISGASDTMILKLDDPTAGTSAQITWDTTDDTYIVAGDPNAIGGVDIMKDGDWRRVWMAVPSGDGTGGTVKAGNARKSQIIIGDADTSEGALAFGAVLLPGEQAPKDYVPDDQHYKALTVADYTFVLNNKRTPAIKATLSNTDSGLTNAEYGETLLFCKAVLNCCHYRLRVTMDDATVHDLDEWTRGVRYIAAGTNNEACGSTKPSTAAIIAGLDTDITTAEANITTKVSTFNDGGSDNDDGGPVLWMTGNATKAIDQVDAWTTKGDHLLAIRDEVESITDLPVMGIHDFRVKVAGDQETGADDYYVKFVGKDAASDLIQQGKWEETLAPGIAYEIDEDTMPHQLVRQQDDAAGTVTGTPYEIYFEFGPAAWDDRNVGDLTTNPDPSFIGRQISDIFFHSNRLGFLADQNVILSEVGQYFNFWRTSITEGTVDSDRVDVASSTTDVVILEDAVTFEDTLLLFSDRSQFLVTGEPSLTPKTAEIVPVFNYETYSAAPPVGVGRGTLMAYKKGLFSGLREIIRAGEEDFQDIDTSGQIPAYISGDITRIEGSSLEDVAVVRSDGDSSKLYIYKWLWNGNEKAQSAWFRWDMGLDADILDVAFIESDLYLVVQRNDSLYLESSRLSTDVKDSSLGWQVRLDRRVQDADCTTSYAAGVNRTSVTVPYGLDKATITGEANKIPLIAVDASTGEQITLSNLVPATKTVDLEGDYDLGGGGGDFFLGFEYEFIHEFGQLSLRDSQGKNEVPRQGRVSLQGCILDLEDTGYLEAHVTLKGKSTRVSEFTPGISGDLVIGQLALADSEFRFPVGGRSDKATVELRSKSPLPCRIMSAEWQLSFSSQSTRFTG